MAEPGLRLQGLDPKVLAVCQSHKARPPPATTAPGRRVGLGKGDEVKDMGELFCVHKSRARATGASPRPNVWPLGSQGRGRRSLVPSCSGTTQGPCLWAGGAAPCGLSCPDGGKCSLGTACPRPVSVACRQRSSPAGPRLSKGDRHVQVTPPGLSPSFPRTHGLCGPRASHTAPDRDAEGPGVPWRWPRAGR